MIERLFNACHIVFEMPFGTVDFKKGETEEIEASRIRRRFDLRTVQAVMGRKCRNSHRPTKSKGGL